MLDPITTADLYALADARGGRRVSIYLPTRRAGPETRENPIRLKNLLRDAEEALAAGGMRRTLAKDMLQPGRDLVDDLQFQENLEEGLAMFFDEDSGMRYFRLPIDVPELAVVSDRFALKPLVKLFSDDAAYYLLAINQNDVRAFRCRRSSIHELRVPGMPRSMAEALWPDDLEKQQQFRSTYSGSAGQGTAVFYGTGDDASDREKEDIARFLNMVDDSFRKAVDDARLPLVLAGVSHILSIYRNVSQYKSVLDQGVEGSTNVATPEHLAAAAWPLVEKLHRERRDEAAARFAAVAGTGQTTSDVREAVRAAREGRVDTLWVADGVQHWGAIEDDGTIVEHETQTPSSDDLLDVAAVEAMRTGARVFVTPAADIPGGGDVAALLRY